MKERWRSGTSAAIVYGLFESLRGCWRPHVHRAWKDVWARAVKLPTYSKGYVNAENLHTINPDSHWERGKPVFLPGDVNIDAGCRCTTILRRVLGGRRSCPPHHESDAWCIVGVICFLKSRLWSPLRWKTTKLQSGQNFLIFHIHAYASTSSLLRYHVACETETWIWAYESSIIYYICYSCRLRSLPKTILEMKRKYTFLWKRLSLNLSHVPSLRLLFALAWRETKNLSLSNTTNKREL